MKDNTLIAAIIEALNNGYAAQDMAYVDVRQAFQPTNQGAPSAPSALLHKVSDHRYGYLKRESVWSSDLVPLLNPDELVILTDPTTGQPVTDPETGEPITVPDQGIPILDPDTNEPILVEGPPYMRHTERQWYESTFSLAAIAIQNPENVDSLTASDIVNMGAAIMQSDATRQALRDKGIGILRVQDVRNPYFVDDKDRFEAYPSFDFTLTHEQVIISTSPVVVSFEGNFKRV